MKWVCLFFVFLIVSSSLLWVFVPGVRADSEVRREISDFVFPLLAEGYTVSELRRALVNFFGDWKVWIGPNRYLELNRTFIVRNYSIVVRIPVFGFYSEPPPPGYEPPGEECGGDDVGGGYGFEVPECYCLNRFHCYCPLSSSLEEFLPGVDVPELEEWRVDVKVLDVGGFLVVFDGGGAWLYLVDEDFVRPFEAVSVRKRWVVDSYYEIF